jgi:hypothetical protein
LRSRLEFQLQSNFKLRWSGLVFNLYLVLISSGSCSEILTVVADIQPRGWMLLVVATPGHLIAYLAGHT